MARLITQRAALTLDGDGWWAIFDATDATIVPLHLRDEGIEHVSLYKGEAEERYWDLAPYLAQMDDSLLEWLREVQWTQPWGIVLQSPASMDELRAHFRKFLRVKDTDGRMLYFRFYDPRVLAAFLPRCHDHELAEFFGPVEAFWTKLRGEDDFLSFSLKPAESAART